MVAVKSMNLLTFWRTYLFAARRFLIDSRSRGLVLRVSFFGFYVMAWLIVFGIVIPMRSAEGAAWHYGFNGFVLLTGFIAFLVLRRLRQRDSELLNCSITGNERLIPNVHSATTEVRTHLASRARVLSSLVLRAAAEIAGSLGQVPIPAEGVMRQVQNGLLRQRQLWTRLEGSETDLMASPEGTWTADQQNELVVWCEQLRLLRWVSGVDRELMPLAHFPRPDFRLVNGIPDRLTNRKQWVASWSVRVERDGALAYAARVLSELRARDLIPESPDLDALDGSCSAVLPW